jgi:gliding motility-associated lipoprotein GldH
MKKTLFFLVLSFLVFSCDQFKIYEGFESIPNMNWELDSKLEFETQLPDTTMGCNVLINVRHAPAFPFQNLYLILKTTYPDGNTATDSLMFYLFKNNGEPMGDCLGDYCDAAFLFRENVRFPMRGKYHFEIAHTMRTADGKLPLIMGVGIRIEQYQSPKP